VARIGVIVNPDAGLGGRLGFKGSDGRALEAREKGAEDRSGPRMKQALSHFHFLSKSKLKFEELTFIVCDGKMGSDWLPDEFLYKSEIVGNWKGLTSADDTNTAVSILLESQIDMLFYSGGDGTTRDIVNSLDKTRNDLPLIGVPAGVKMHSGCFASTPNAAAEVLSAWLDGDLGLAITEVMDLDEELYREGEWKIRMFAEATTPSSPKWMQGSKELVNAPSEEDIIEGIGQNLKEIIEDEPEKIIVWGSGGTLLRLARHCGFETTLLGIDITLGSEVLGIDLNELQIIEILEKNKLNKNKLLLLSPMGGQGFILGRGNLQLSPNVIRGIGIENILGVATPAKLMVLDTLRIDTGDYELDQKIKSNKYLKLLQGYRTTRIVKISED